MLNLHRDKKIVRREPGRDGKILCDHRQDPSAISEMKERKKERKKSTNCNDVIEQSCNTT